MTELFEDELQGWDHIKAEIGILLPEPSQSALHASATAFVAAASSIPPPNDVGRGYWRISIRLTWPSSEVEVFASSIEIYRFHSAGTDIATIPFRSGYELPEDWVQWLAKPDLIAHRIPGDSPTGAKES